MIDAWLEIEVEDYGFCLLLYRNEDDHNGAERCRGPGRSMSPGM
jgi:hypothetical protein